MRSEVATILHRLTDCQLDQAGAVKSLHTALGGWNI